MTEISDINQQFSNTIKIVFLIMAGLVLPIILIPIIKFIGYSEIIEEIAKALVVLFLILKLPSFKIKILLGVIFGFLFGVSESMFYLNNIFQLGDFSVFWQRIFWTVPMHIFTVLIIVFSGLASKKFLIFGLAGAIISHVLFNGIVIDMLTGR